MKNTVLLLWGLMLSTHVFSQNITEIFIGLPDRAVFGLTSVQRQVLVEKSEAGTDVPFENGFEYQVNAIDKKNGYFSMYRDGEEGRNELQVCYWNLANGDKLIAVYEEWEYHMLRGAENLQFFLFNGQDYRLLNGHDIIPEISRKSDTLLADIESLFFGRDYQQTKNKMEEESLVMTNLICILPQQGKNITLILNSDDEESSEHEKKILQKYKIRGNRMELIWENGKFAKGRIQWEQIVN